MTTPTLEQFLEDVKNHELTICQNDCVYRHLEFKNPKHHNHYFSISTLPNYLLITGYMGTLVFSRQYDMFDFFRSDDLKINPYHWSRQIQSTTQRAAEASFLEFDRKILSCSGDEFEIVGEIKNFNCHSFKFIDFLEDDYTEYTYSYIWLCYAIVWGIKKFDEVSQEIKKEKQAKLEKLSEELAKERLLTRERVKEKQKEELAEIDKAREHAWKEVQIVCGFNEMQLTAGERGVYYGFFLHGWNYAGAYYRKREDSLRLLHHEKVMKLAVSYASLIKERFALGGK